MIKKIFLLLTIINLSACSLLPYKEKSTCASIDDYGRCISIQDAYQEALTGNHAGGIEINPGRKNSNKTNNVNKNNIVNKKIDISKDINRYNNARYKELTSLIEAKKTPLLKPSVTRSVLITAYPSKDKTVFYDSRVIYYIEENTQWILDAIEEKNINQVNGIEVYQ